MPKKNYTKAEFDFIKKHSSTMPPQQIGEHLGRTTWAIKCKIYVLGLPTYKTERKTVWTAEKLVELKRCYPNERTKTISERLKISEPMIREKARQLNLRKNKEFGYWKMPEVSKLKELIAKGCSIRKIAKELDKTIGSVYTKIYSTGITVSQIKAARAKKPKTFIHLD